MKSHFFFGSALLVLALAGCGGSSGGGAPASRAVLRPPADKGIGFGFDENGEPVYGQQIPNGIRTYGLGGVRTNIPVTSLPETFNVTYGNLIVAYWQGTGAFYVVRPDGFKRAFTATRFVGSDGAWTILAKDAEGYSFYNAQTDSKTAAPLSAGDHGWGYSGTFIGGQEGDGGVGKRAYILPSAGGAPVWLTTPPNTSQVLPQVLLADGRSIGSIKTDVGNYVMLAWAADGSYIQLGEASTDILSPVGYANDGTYAYVRRSPSGQQSFVVFPGQAATPASSFGVPAAYTIQALSSNGRYLFAGPVNGDTPSAYQLVR